MSTLAIAGCPLIVNAAAVQEVEDPVTAAHHGRAVTESNFTKSLNPSINQSLTAALASVESAHD
ncbi:MAG: hypothetical protein ACE14L_17975 [Terriglobales bacterium]